MNDADHLQRILKLAEEAGVGVKFSPKRKVAHFRKGDMYMSAHLWLDEDELWVNFDCDVYSGNDPVSDFVATFEGWLQNELR